MRSRGVAPLYTTTPPHPPLRHTGVEFGQVTLGCGDVILFLAAQTQSTQRSAPILGSGQHCDCGGSTLCGAYILKYQLEVEVGATSVSARETFPIGYCLSRRARSLVRLKCAQT